MSGTLTSPPAGRKPSVGRVGARARALIRNVRLLAGSATQHLLDDPALLAVQVSRRLPMPLRIGTGRVLQSLGDVGKGDAGVSALGAIMSGDTDLAERFLEQGQSAPSRLHGEIAVLADRVDLLDDRTRPSTRARALWAQGRLSESVEVLESAGHGSSAQAERLRSELRMLQSGFALTAPPTDTRAEASRDGEQLRVLHLLTNSLPHTQSGYAVRTHNILTALRDRGIASIALTRTGYPVMVGKVLCAKSDQIDGILYRRTLPPMLSSTPQGRLDQEVAEALRTVEEFRPHVLHATTDYRNALVAQAVSAATGIPWILEVRGLQEKTWIASRRSESTREQAALSEKVRLIVGAESGLARRAGAVVTLSSTMAKVLADKGVPGDRITLVPNGVDDTLLDEDLSPARARTQLPLEIPADALAIGAVSALVEYEGFDVLLRAAAAMIGDASTPQSVRDRIRVVVVGDGVSAPGLRALAHQLGIQGRVLMPGRVPRGEARVWVQALDVVVVPRRDLEVSRTVTPQKPVEAMALARPVVVSDLPALRETVDDGEGNPVGALVPADDPESLAAALLELLRDPQQRARMAAAGRDIASQRTWHALMERYQQVYETVLSRVDTADT